MEDITLRELIHAVSGTVLGDFAPLDLVISHVDTDSRNIHENSLFLPLIGDRFDGHAYISSALEKGALGCLTSRPRETYLDGKFYIKVQNTQKALGELAAWYQSRFQIPFIAVTGSVGKTTTKDMIAAVLSVKYNVLKTEGNFNNAIGLPLTLLRLRKEHEVCVLEMGMDHAGEIDYLGAMVKPNFAVITNIGDAHIEQLGTRENILKAKCELLPHIKADGLLCLNGDDPLLASLQGNTPCETMFFGTEDGNNLLAKDIQTNGDSFITCKIEGNAISRTVKIPALGQHMVYPALSAIAIGQKLGLSPDELVDGITRFVPTKMRMNILHRGDNITIFDDTYNANPQSMRAAIQVLADGHGEKKIAILGDMLELGPFAPTLHAGIGECLASGNISCLIAIGELSVRMAESATASGVSSVFHCQDKDAAKPIIKSQITPNSLILLKASRGMALDELTNYILSITKDNDA